MFIKINDVEYMKDPEIHAAGQDLSKENINLCPSSAFSRLKHPFRLRTQKLRL